jgi:hypothetical protein
VLQEKAHVTIVGPRWDLLCHDVRDFLFRNHISFAWLDPTDTDAAVHVPADLRDAPGSQAGTSSRIENYLGFPTGVSGDELGKRALHQATRDGSHLAQAQCPGFDGAQRARCTVESDALFVFIGADAETPARDHACA